MFAGTIAVPGLRMIRRKTLPAADPGDHPVRLRCSADRSYAGGPSAGRCPPPSDSYARRDHTRWPGHDRMPGIRTGRPRFIQANAIVENEDAVSRVRPASAADGTLELSLLRAATGAPAGTSVAGSIRGVVVNTCTHSSSVVLLSMRERRLLESRPRSRRRWTVVEQAIRVVFCGVAGAAGILLLVILLTLDWVRSGFRERGRSKQGGASPTRSGTSSGHVAAFLRRGQWSSAVLVRVSCRPWPRCRTDVPKSSSAS